MKDLTDPDFQQSLSIALQVIKLPLRRISTRDRNAMFAFYALKLAHRLKMMGYTFTKKPPAGGHGGGYGRGVD